MIGVVAFTISFNEEKNQLLKATRGIGFEDVITAIQTGGLLADITYPSLERAHQRLYAVRIGAYVYAVPYVINIPRQELFLKTIYPSRTLTKQYTQGGNHDQK